MNSLIKNIVILIVCIMFLSCSTVKNEPSDKDITHTPADRLDNVGRSF